MVATAARRPRSTARHLRRGDVSRSRRRRDQTPCAAKLVGARAAFAQGGLGSGGRRGGPAPGADHRLPILGRTVGLDRRRGDRDIGGRSTPSWWIASKSCCPTRCCVTNSAPRRRPAAANSPGRKAPTPCARCAGGGARPASSSAAWSSGRADRERHAPTTAPAPPTISTASHARCAISVARAARRRTHRRCRRRSDRARTRRRDRPASARRGCGRPHPCRRRVSDSTTSQPTPAGANATGRAPPAATVAPRGRGRPRPGWSIPEMARSPVISTSARTQRGSGSSTGAGPDQEKRRMVPAGNTATAPGRALIAAATAAQPGGYCTGDTWPQTPQARSGRAKISARQQTSAVTNAAAAPTAAASPSRPRPPACIPAPPAPPTSARRAARRGRARRRPPRRSRCRPGPVANAAGTSTDTTASTSSGIAAGRRTTVGNPAATTPSSTTAEDTAKSVVRETVRPRRSRFRQGWPGCRACPGRARRAARTPLTPSVFAAVVGGQRRAQRRRRQPGQRRHQRGTQRRRGA